MRSGVIRLSWNRDCERYAGSCRLIIRFSCAARVQEEWAHSTLLEIGRPRTVAVRGFESNTC